MTIKDAINEMKKADELSEELNEAIRESMVAEGTDDLHQFSVQIGAECAEDLQMMLTEYKALIGGLDVAWAK